MLMAKKDAVCIINIKQSQDTWATACVDNVVKTKESIPHCPATLQRSKCASEKSDE